MNENIIYDNNCECSRTKGIFFFEPATSKIIKASCKAYICDICGPRKVAKFRTALTKYLNSFEFIRLFTFTQHTPDNLGTEKQNDLFSKAWALFVKEVRRDKSLSKKQRKFQYVRVVEFTNRGYLHAHVCINTFLPILKIRNHWNTALYSVFGEIGGRGGINIKTISNQKHVANYLTKYLAKSAKHVFGNVRRWSKSNNISIFEKFESTGKWFSFSCNANGVLNLNIKSITPQKIDGKFYVSISEIFKKQKILNSLIEVLSQKAQNSLSVNFDSIGIAKS